MVDINGFSIFKQFACELGWRGLNIVCLLRAIIKLHLLPMAANLVSTPAISVLMPCHNAAATLQTALNSLYVQTLQNIEIIAVDDGSNDETAAILRRQAEIEPRLRIICQPHQGIISALNTGLADCLAPYIARMDADDYSYPERLERQLDYLESHANIAVVGCLVEGFPSENLREGFRIYIDWQNSLISNGDICREIFVESPMAHPSTTMRKSWVDGAGGYQENGWPEDYDLWLRLYLDGGQFAKVPEKLFRWRERPDRLTRTDRRYSLENFLRAKAHYLARGPLAEREAVIIWGAGMMGRRLSKHLQLQGAPLAAFVDIDPAKIGRTRRGLPILAPDALPEFLGRFSDPIVLAAVGARGARALIRQRLNEIGLEEGADWWSVA